MLTFSQYLDINSDVRIVSSCYANTFRSEYIILELSDNTLLVHTTSPRIQGSVTRILPWFKGQKISTMKFSNYDTLLNILTTNGLIVRIPVHVLFHSETVKFWEGLVHSENPEVYIKEFRAQRDKEDKKSAISKLSNILKGSLLDKAEDQQQQTIYLQQNSSIHNIELVRVKYSNLKNPSDLSYVVHVNVSTTNNSKNGELINAYSNFSDFELWRNSKKEEFLIVSTMTGVVFFVREGKQVLVYRFDFGIVSIKVLKQENKTSLLVENDLGDYLSLLLEKRSEDLVSTVTEDYRKKSFQADYADFKGGSTLLFENPSKSQPQPKIYEYSKADSKVRIFKKLQAEDEYSVDIPDILYIVEWNSFLLVVHGYGPKINFSLFSGQNEAKQQESRIKGDENIEHNGKRNLRYFDKLRQKNSCVVLQSSFEIQGNVIDIRQVKQEEGENGVRGIYLCICTSGSFYYTTMRVEGILEQLEQKFLQGIITKNDYNLYTYCCEHCLEDTDSTESCLKEKLKVNKREDVLFDMEVFEIMKHKGDDVDGLDFNGIIKKYISCDNIVVLKAILSFVVEKILSTRDLHPHTIAYYTIAIFYCCWQSVLQEDFGKFVTSRNLENLEKIYSNHGYNIELPEKLMHVIIYLSYNFKLKFMHQKFVTVMTLFETVVQSSYEDSALKMLLLGNSNQTYKELLIKEQKFIPKTYALPVLIMQEKPRKDNWTAICSALSTQESSVLIDILRTLVMELGALRSDEILFELGNFSELWTFSIISLPQNETFNPLFSHIFELLGLKIDYKTPELDKTLLEALKGSLSPSSSIAADVDVSSQISYMCLILILLKSKEKRGDRWTKLLNSFFNILKRSSFKLDENLLFACVTLDEPDLFNNLQELYV